MYHESAVKQSGKPRILVTPLDWGLGHATRCIPLIYELQRQNFDVWLAGELAQEALLREEFPNLPFLNLKGYRVKYGSTRAGLVRAIFFQLPNLLKAIKRENAWLQEAVAGYQFDAVVSDNRFGMHHPKIRTVFITHQLSIKSGLGKWLDKRLQKRNYSFINRFTECWIPDLPGEVSLAGELSHPVNLPAVPTHYIGLLSRLKKNDQGRQKGHLFISLSGPEPQRSLLENKIVDSISHYRGSATVVRGLPGQASLIPSTNDIRFFNHLPTEAYNEEMEKADFVISRSGYSTVMDIARLGKKSILIPTPGQPEQEYLAQYLMEKQFALCEKQDHFQLEKALQKAMDFDYNISGDYRVSPLASAVESFLQRLSLKEGKLS